MSSLHDDDDDERRASPAMTSPVTFEGYIGSWNYYKDKKLYDVSRDVTEPFYSFGTTQGQPDTTVLIGNRITALVIVDMQNYFLHPRCNDYPEGREAAERTLEVIAKCRQLNIQIIWLYWSLAYLDILTMPPAAHWSFASQLINEEEDGKRPEGAGQWRRGFHEDMGSGRGKLLRAGSWNAELYDPLRKARDSILDRFCEKTRMSGLWSDSTDLHLVIDRKFVTLLFAGVNTDQCVLGTLVDAYNRGYDCVMLEDCCATKTPGGKEATTWNVSMLRLCDR
ncbi:Isochorismatase-like protein [Xylaria sp. FL0064]|nr:Isochorismatase-like protein [Xylaria sp. FL0064]